LIVLLQTDRQTELRLPLFKRRVTSDRLWQAQLPAKQQKHVLPEPANFIAKFRFRATVWRAKH